MKHTTKTATPQTAAEAYAKRAAEMRIYLSILNAWLDQKGPKPDEAHWGHVGTLGHINEHLEEILECLGEDNY